MVATFVVLVLVLVLVGVESGEFLFRHANKGLNAFQMKQFFCKSASMLALSM